MAMLYWIHVGHRGTIQEDPEKNYMKRRAIQGMPIGLAVPHETFTYVRHTKWLNLIMLARQNPRSADSAGRIQRDAVVAALSPVLSCVLPCGSTPPPELSATSFTGQS